MLSATHNLEAQGPYQAERLALCRCGRCDNEWWVRAAVEHEPSFCPYCGMNFKFYTGPDGTPYSQSGLPL